MGDVTELLRRARADDAGAIDQIIALVYPDLRFIEEERHNLLGIFITHAHEDHIGALVEMWPRLRAPVYATKFAIGLLETRRLSEPRLLTASRR